MLDIKFIQDNQAMLQKAIADKQMNPQVIGNVLSLHDRRRALVSQIQKIREEANSFQKGITGKPSSEQIEKGRSYKHELSNLEPELKKLDEMFDDLMLQVPNPAASDVPVGKDENNNQEVRRVGEIPSFSFKPKSHEELALALDLYDAKRAVKIAGFRAYFLKNELVLLEQALLNFALELMVKKGFVPITVPWMVNKAALWGTGYFPWGMEDHYTTQDDQGLIGTAEVSLTAYHQDEVLDEVDLPIKLVGISPCFRREVGAHGKDTKGFIRVHQFTKVEQVVLTQADEAVTREWHEKMVGFSEELLTALKLPYHVLLMCTGDMGAGQRKKYDIETWFPSQNAYRETHSASYFNDFQSRRLKIRYKTKDGSLKYVYTLNNTVAASPRLLAALIENYQQEDGSIKIPSVLQKWMGDTLQISAKI